MRIPTFAALALLAGAAVLAQPIDAVAGGKKHRIQRGGDHYDNVMSNYIRRCDDLSRQFDRALAERPASAQTAEAVALYQLGVAHCDGGARMRGIDELTDAIRLIGAIPRVNL